MQRGDKPGESVQNVQKGVGARWYREYMPSKKAEQITLQVLAA